MYVNGFIFVSFTSPIFHLLYLRCQGVIWVNFVLFGLSVIPFTYIFSFMFASHSTAQNVMVHAHFISVHF
jgi:hypothetical protein